LDAFLAYKAVNGKPVPVQLVVAPSKHQAQKAVESLGLVSLTPVNEVEDVADVLRLVLPTLVMGLGAVQQLLAVVAQDANERIQERAKRGLGLVRGN
jgi:hypothetical protein